MSTTLYEQQHAALIALAKRLPTSGALVNAEQAKTALLALGHPLREHLNLEDMFLYPALLSHWNPQVREKAQVFKEEMGGLAAAFDAFEHKWRHGDDIRTSPHAFVAEWKCILGALTTRMKREDTDLFVDANEDRRRKPRASPSAAWLKKRAA